MPFTQTRHGVSPNEIVITKKQWDHIYERWIKRAVESYEGDSFICKRSPAKPGNFIKGIIGDIASSNLVIADLTGERPNVYYELGIRHALRTGSIIITQHLSALPSDLASYFAFEYTYSEKDFEYENYYRLFETSLHKTIAEMENSTDPSDSPVSDFFGLRHQLLEQTLAEEKAEFRWLLENIGEALNQNYRVCEQMYDSVVLNKKVTFSALPVIDLFPLEVLYTRLFSIPWRIHKPETLRATAELLTAERRNFILYQRLFDQASLAKPDSAILAGAFAAFSKAIVESRKEFKKHWQNVLGAKIEYELIWGNKKRRRKRQ
ncbi:MAG: hypothetical protein WDM80_17230 [Limisphaerales bacterium]